MSVVAPLIFHSLRLKRFQPVLLYAICIAVILLLCSIASYLFNANKFAYERALISQLQTARVPSVPPVVTGPPALPLFDEAMLPAAIELASTSAQVKTDEFVFSLEDGATLPYRRYRVSMNLAGRYLQIRAAVTGILQQVPFSSLDAIKCTRADIGEAEVTCNVTMSAFYRHARS